MNCVFLMDEYIHDDDIHFHRVRIRNIPIESPHLFCIRNAGYFSSYTYNKIMHELPWITIFGSRVRRFAHESLVNRITSDPKIVIQGNECIILFLTRYCVSLKHNFSKNNHRSLISHLSPRTVFLTWHCEVTTAVDLWRHANARN